MRWLTLALLLFTPAAHAQISGNSMGGDLVFDAAPDGGTLRTMGGDIRVKSAGGKLVAKTMGGSIRVDRVDGSVVASTMGGEVDVEVFGGGSKREVELHTMGGSIEITLPADFGADFEVELERDEDDDTDRIESDFPLKITESRRRRWFKTVTVFRATGTSGSGANRVKITAIGGSVKVRRR